MAPPFLSFLRLHRAHPPAVAPVSPTSDDALAPASGSDVEHSPEPEPNARKPRLARLRHPTILYPLLVALLLLVVLAVLAPALALHAQHHHQPHGRGGGGAPEPLPPGPPSVTVTLAAQAPAGAPALPRAPVGLSIEGDRWPEWAGVAAPNVLVRNALLALTDKTGVPPPFRIGANSEDRTIYDASVQYSSAVFPASSGTIPYPEARNVSVGAGYYGLAARLPAGTRVTWGVNLGARNRTAALLEARAILAAFDASATRAAGVQLDFIEVGNEADLYEENGLRPAGYSAADYVAEWTEYAANISETLGLANRSAPRFWGGSFSASTHTTSGFSPQSVLGSGLQSSSAGSLISAYSQHQYSGQACDGSRAILQELMLKAHTRGNLSLLVPDIAAARAHGLDYIGGEMNSIACHGAAGSSDTAGAALWLLDYVLYAPQLGISQVYLHNGVGFKYNLIQPVALSRSIDNGSALAAPLAPHVQPAFYGALIAAEAAGTSPGGTVAADVPVGDDAYLAAYAFYDGAGAPLVRALFINARAWLAADAKAGTRARSTTHVALAGAPAGQMSVKRLAIRYADDMRNLTWGGQTYETADGSVGGAEVVETVDVADGFNITETEVVMLTFLTS